MRVLEWSLQPVLCQPSHDFENLLGSIDMTVQRGYVVDSTGVARIGNALPLDLARKLAWQKLLSRIEVNENGCWVWQGWCNPMWGYGFMCFRNKNWRVHCLVWELTRGEIPKGMVIRHKCDNPPCCNPFHLEIGTHRDNVHDRMRRGRDHHSNLTHCPRGHSYEEHGARYGKSRFRSCRVCVRAAYRMKLGWQKILRTPRRPERA